ncbi:DUF3888 domain-containing protein [Cytobacillus firmus]|uniref:DUF3888 domain-containing protein n=1 Tax=Cytobacillus firmus DS1 TaxID=1307436 RepID=W7L9R2_CYTFI|nr:DUF3888 domain-containing protein [Cytobacillus firmus]EWG08559.1 hypothetical protein PBF_23725 [Cytobacillus firmus DS1]MBG9549682.1 hypothetical protein [Cytobacillus firmus]MBG9604064.1 hypothetical protein [Cytobacillus firmus]MED1943124.1 DUF3888 domain-containing protein [Cytobacillus firmus]
MNRLFAILIIVVLMNTTTTSYAKSIRSESKRENILEDAVIDLLTQPMYAAVKDYYGTTYKIGSFCEKVKEVKKLRHSGSWCFEVKIEFVIFTGAHNFLDIFTVTLKKDWGTEGKWIMQEYNVRKYDPNEKYECRSPA